MKNKKTLRFCPRVRYIGHLSGVKFSVGNTSPGAPLHKGGVQEEGETDPKIRYKEFQALPYTLMLIDVAVKTTAP